MFRGLKLGVYGVLRTYWRYLWRVPAPSVTCVEDLGEASSMRPGIARYMYASGARAGTAFPRAREFARERWGAPEA